MPSFGGEEFPRQREELARQGEEFGVRFKEDIEMLDGPVVCADDQPPLKPGEKEKEGKEKKFFFFKKKKKVRDTSESRLQIIICLSCVTVTLIMFQIHLLQSKTK